MKTCSRCDLPSAVPSSLSVTSELVARRWLYERGITLPQQTTVDAVNDLFSELATARRMAERGQDAETEKIERGTEILRLRAELATARQERDDAYALLEKSAGGVRAELVEVRRQLAELTRALKLAET